MCRLYGFLANEPTKVECTLVHAQNALLHQSRADLRGHAHSDGWGISCYPNGFPQRERRATAAHEDIWFSTTAERTYSHAVVAHIRRATVGGASLENTHPFVHGCWTFAHNGTLANFKELEQQLDLEVAPIFRKQRSGTTDSELIFLWLLTRFRKAEITLDRPRCEIEQLVNLMTSALTRLRKMSELASASKDSQLNFMLTNGQLLLATRWNHTLHYIERIGLHDCEICGIPHVQHDQKEEYRACVVASEPISHEPWKSLTNHSILVVDNTAKVHLFPAI